MITIRLTNERDWACEFDAIDAQSFAAGCRNAWLKYKKQFGERHLHAKHTINRRISDIDRWEHIKMEQWADRPDNQKCCSQQAHAWKCKIKHEKSAELMPDFMYLHVKSMSGFGWVTSGKPTAQSYAVYRDKINDWDALWAACYRSHLHDAARCDFVDGIGDFLRKNDRSTNFTVIDGGL